MVSAVCEFYKLFLHCCWQKTAFDDKNLYLYYKWKGAKMLARNLLWRRYFFTGKVNTWDASVWLADTDILSLSIDRYLIPCHIVKKKKSFLGFLFNDRSLHGLVLQIITLSGVYYWSYTFDSQLYSRKTHFQMAVVFNKINLVKVLSAGQNVSVQCWIFEYIWCYSSISVTATLATQHCANINNL